MIILIHSSKTMRAPALPAGRTPRAPELLDRAKRLGTYIQTLSPEAIADGMRVSAPLAARTHATYADWTADPSAGSLAIDSFAGDIYSGLQAAALDPADRDYADGVLRILSGLYGILRPYDTIRPYRLELMYRLPDPAYSNLYAFWGDAVARTLPSDDLIVNLAAVEYARTVTAYKDAAHIVTPKFLTVNPATGKPVFVVVHAKIARGAFARWLIQKRITSVDDLPAFTDLNYRYDPALSSVSEPVFVCRAFGGLGLSVRLQKA